MAAGSAPVSAVGQAQGSGGGGVCAEAAGRVHAASMYDPPTGKAARGGATRDFPQVPPRPGLKALRVWYVGILSASCHGPQMTEWAAVRAKTAPP